MMNNPRLNFNPMPIPIGKIWYGKYFHFTYKSFIDIVLFLCMIRSVTTTPFLAWSYAHERGGDDEDEDGYEHSHFAIIFKAPIRAIGSRKFDITVISDDGTDATRYHPHILPKVTVAHMETIFLNYHVGRKYSAETGKIVYKKPVKNDSFIEPEYDFCKFQIDEVLEAPSLIEACIAGAIRPRSVMDIRILRDESHAVAANTFIHQYPRDSFYDIGPANFTALHIWGGTNMGKTKWALNKFNNPCPIKPFNSIGSLEALGKKFDPLIHDGIVLDEVDLTFLSREQVIALLDYDEACELNVRYKHITIPPRVKKILVSNGAPHTLYPADPHGAIARRMETLWIRAPTYHAQALGQVAQDAQGTPPTQPAA